MKKRCLIGVLAALQSAGGLACEVTAQQIQFPGQGTHTAYYCKATGGERRQAIEAVKLEKCVGRKLAEFGKSPQASEANEVIPFGLTRAEAQKAGPIFDVRLTLEVNSDRRAGYRALAQGRRWGTRIDFEVSDALYFERDCPATGCTDRVLSLCETTRFP
jgi:hypothetical protein